MEGRLAYAAAESERQKQGGLSGFAGIGFGLKNVQRNRDWRGCYAKIYIIGLVGAVHLGGLEKERTDSDKYPVVWDWRYDAAPDFSCLLDLQYLIGNFSGGGSDGHELGQPGQYWDGRWNPSYGNWRISGGCSKFGIIFNRAFIFCPVGYGACSIL